MNDIGEQLNQGKQLKLACALWLHPRSRFLSHSCYLHPFVRGIATGELARKSFAQYIGQDYFFLHAFHKAYMQGSRRSNNEETKAAFLALAQGVLEELKLHASYSIELGINLQSIEPYSATTKYINFLAQISEEGNLVELVASMVPCMRLYAWLGQSISTFLSFLG